MGCRTRLGICCEIVSQPFAVAGQRNDRRPRHARFYRASGHEMAHHAQRRTPWSMLWKDLAPGFLIGGFLAAFVPDDFWKALFLTDAPPWIKVPLNVLLGPLVAVLTFVCSIGNTPSVSLRLHGRRWGRATHEPIIRVGVLSGSETPRRSRSCRPWCRCCTQSRGWA